MAKKADTFTCYDIFTPVNEHTGNRITFNKIILFLKKGNYPVFPGYYLLLCQPGFATGTFLFRYRPTPNGMRNVTA
jgi:hypothetical protein